MKLIRLSIEDWRGFRGGPWSIDFDPRVTLVHGENEAGKSTLFEAIRWALFERAKKSSREVPKIVPFDRPGAEPTVRLAFEHGGECWTIEKRFGKKGTALLSRQLANGQREELARHDEATERVVERIGAQLRKSGESKPSDWGVLRWLFMPQEPTARLLPDAKSDAVNSLGLERAAGTSKTFERIASRVATALDRHYTASGAYKSTSEIKIAEDNIADFERAIQRLRDELSESDDLRAQYDALREELPLIEAELAVARREWEVVQSETRDFDVQVEGRNTDEERRLRLEQELKSCEALVARREALDRRVKDAAARVEAARQKDTEHRYLAQRAQVSLEAARHEQDAARRGDKLARDTLEAARRNREEGRVAAELERLDAIIERARGLDTEIRSAAAAMGTTAPTAKDVQRAEALSLDLARHEAALSAVQLHVKVDDPELEVLVDGQEIESPEASADDLVEVRRRGQTKGVRIAGDSERAKARRQVADRTRDELESLLRSHGTESTTGLRRLAHAGEMRAATLVEKRSAREALDHRDTESLQAERARLAASLAAGGDLDRTITTDVAELERQADAASRQLEGLESDYARLEARRDETREVSAASAQQLVLAIEAHEQSSREREEHAGAYGSLDGLRDQADAKRRDVQDASQRARSRALDLDARQKQASTRHDTAKQQHDGLQALFVEKRSKKNQLIEDLERRAVRGAWSELGRVERRLDSERSRLDRLVAIAKGTMLIREAIESVRTEMLDELVAPVRDAFQDYLSFVTRGRYQSARLDVGMTPSEISTRNGQVLAFDQGSEGLRELTNALLRIAVAVDLGRKSPQVLILDDPCAHVSRDRSRRFSELVNRVVREHPVQIIVLSHRPTELLGLCGSTIDLANLRSDQATAAE